MVLFSEFQQVLVDTLIFLWFQNVVKEKNKQEHQELARCLNFIVSQQREVVSVNNVIHCISLW